MSEVRPAPQWLVRVRLERDDLEGKLHRLQAFMQTEAFENLSGDERMRLHRQDFYMGGYLRVLKARIEAAEKAVTA